MVNYHPPENFDIKIGDKVSIIRVRGYHGTPEPSKVVSIENGKVTTESGWVGAVGFDIIRRV